MKELKSRSQTAKLKTPVKAKDRIYMCTSCGKEYTRLSGNFFKSKSPYYKANDYHLPICRHCTENYFLQYQEEMGLSEEEALKRIAMHCDFYFGQKILEASESGADLKSVGRLSGFLKVANLSQFSGKTFDTYLNEQESDEAVIDASKYRNMEEEKITDLGFSAEDVEFFGFGYTSEDYIWLSSQYKDWISRHECKTKAQEEIFKNLSIIQLQIQKNGHAGKSYDRLINSYNTLMTSANIKPVQTQDNTLTDQNTFGTLIQKWENEQPIPEAAEEFKDVDGIAEYIGVWFFGHLCKMFGIKNSYSEKYEKAISEQTVAPPEYVEEEDGSIDEMLEKLKQSEDSENSDVVIED